MTRTRQTTQPNERLRRLDHELMVTRTRSFDYLYAVGKGARIRVCVQRDADNKCFATATVGNRVLKSPGGYRPSAAFKQLLIAIRVQLAQMPEADRVEAVLQSHDEFLHGRATAVCFFNGNSDKRCRKCLDCADHYQ